MGRTRKFALPSNQGATITPGPMSNVQSLGGGPAGSLPMLEGWARALVAKNAKVTRNGAMERCTAISTRRNTYESVTEIGRETAFFYLVFKAKKAALRVVAKATHAA